ncbi:DUF421 domain-containing protein [Marinovum sp.]|uniref:DUF421 domain-containing protein n=1 Tax=Marinovum sp. TaxID=2024839 RepID=UPI002B26A70C|nr:YetF domain-containing protein [Marinovum sp.]
MFAEYAPFDVLLRALLLSTLAMFWVIFVVRCIGLRAFSKMTSFDFVATVAVGSLLAGASQATEWGEFFQPALAISVLLGVQYVIARARKASDLVEHSVQNTPVLLMRDGVILDGALEATRVSQGDLIAKLREANVLDFSEVRAVVLETTGDLSVLHGEALSPHLLDGVQRRDDGAVAPPAKPG